MNWFRITAEILEHIASKFREASEEVIVVAPPVEQIEENSTPINFAKFTPRTIRWLTTQGIKTEEHLLSRSVQELITLGMGGSVLDEVIKYKEYIRGRHV